MNYPGTKVLRASAGLAVTSVLGSKLICGFSAFLQELRLGSPQKQDKAVVRN